MENYSLPLLIKNYYDLYKNTLKIYLKIFLFSDCSVNKSQIKRYIGLYI